MKFSPITITPNHEPLETWSLKDVDDAMRDLRRAHRALKRNDKDALAALQVAPYDVLASADALEFTEMASPNGHGEELTVCKSNGGKLRPLFKTLL